MFETPLTTESPRKQEVFQERLECLQKLKQACGHFDDLRDPEIFFPLHCQRNQITAFNEREVTDTIMLVPTGAGVMTEKGQDIATDHLFSCAGLLILGPTKNGLIHLTPSSNLPYRDVDFSEDKSINRRGSAQKILEALEVNEQPLEQTRMVILVNAGNTSKNAKFYYQDTDRATSDLVHIFLEAGVASVRVVELPLDNSLIFHSDDQPDTLEVFGNPASYSSTGELLIDAATVEHFSIGVDPNIPLPFQINRPSPEAILLEQERILDQKYPQRNSPDPMSYADLFE
jgi:hypothetical protein